MRILAVNWLDRNNPQAGGAEVHFFEIFRRLVSRGHQVTLVTSGFPGCEPTVTLDGLRVIRVGGRHTFALLGAMAVVRQLNRGTYDVVVEDINKLPLFLPAVTRIPLYVIIPHLFGTTAFVEASFPVAATVWAAEQPLPFIYRGAAFHAISHSTKADLVGRGVDADAVRVIFPGVDHDWFTPGDAAARSATPTFLYVGRIKRYKGLEIVIRALGAPQLADSGVRLAIAGTGDDRGRLSRVAQQCGVAGAVDFLGFVSEEKKRDLLRKAWAVVFPSAKEGWGITNIEAAACGTPTISSDAPGLRETARDGETGVLVPHGDVHAFAAAMRRISSDRDLVTSLGGQARHFAETFSWDSAAGQTETHLLETIQSFQTDTR